MSDCGFNAISWKQWKCIFRRQFIQLIFFVVVEWNHLEHSTVFNCTHSKSFDCIYIRMIYRFKIIFNGMIFAYFADGIINLFFFKMKYVFIMLSCANNPTLYGQFRGKFNIYIYLFNPWHIHTQYPANRFNSFV